MVQHRQSRTRFLERWPSFAVTTVLAVITTACGVELDSPVEVDSLRVLAVRKSQPYTSPGEQVELSMLWHDGTRNEEGEPRDADVERVWLGGCTNPPGDFYFGCAPDVLSTLAAFRAAQAGLSPSELAAAASGLAGVDSESGLRAALESLPFDFEGPLLADGVPDEPLAIGQLGRGDRFMLAVPASNVLKNPPGDGPQYGVLFPFFAACVGTLHVSLDVLDQTLPLVCKNDAGEVLGSDDFVVGYASVYVYEELQNRNAIIDGFEVDGFATQVPASAVDDPPDLGSPFLCANEDCLVPDEPVAEGEPCTRHLECASEHCANGVCGERVEPKCGVNVPCIEPCADDGDVETCDEIPIRPVLDQGKNVELDPMSSVEGTTYEEQMWVNYYVDRGSVASVVRLVNDSAKGWNADYGTDLVAPQGSSERSRMHIWAVVRDNRGGASWVRQTVYVKRGD